MEKKENFIKVIKISPLVLDHKPLVTVGQVEFLCPVHMLLWMEKQCKSVPCNCKGFDISNCDLDVILIRIVI